MKASLLSYIPFFLETATSAPTLRNIIEGLPSNTASSHESGGEEHIVLIANDAPITPQVAEVLRRLDLNETHPDVRHVFNNSAFQGFAASMKSHCLDLLANMSDISTVEKTVTISAADINQRANSPWGLQRISTSTSTSLGGGGGDPQSLDYTYTFSDSTLGSGADVYIIDTGVYTAHQIFNGRAQTLWSYNASDSTDTDGHGTHTAGTAAGSILGVASNANIYALKALADGGGGSSADVISAIDRVIQNHDSRKSSSSSSSSDGSSSPFVGSVMSMSLASGSPIPSLNQAIQGAIQAGVHTCVAAGNSGADACSSSPASAGGQQGGAITVGAVDISAEIASFSNTGRCVDLYAPGVDIVSSWIGSPNMVNMISGTSMAAPHVTGLVAYAMAANKTLAQNPGLMKEWLIMMALDMGSNGTLLANNGVLS